MQSVFASDSTKYKLHFEYFHALSSSYHRHCYHADKPGLIFIRLLKVTFWT